MMAFDFAAYLSSIDSISSYEIEPLTGGLVNSTVRASKTSVVDVGVFPGRSSLVLKHAPPYIAAVGPEAPFSQDRQLVEAAALSLFEPTEPFHEIGNSADVQVKTPQLLLHDVEASVIVMEDLGQLLTLWDILSPKPHENTAPVQPSNLQNFCLDIGQRLGAFFGKLHAHDVQSLQDTVSHSAKSSILSNTLSRDVVYDAAVKPIQERLISHIAANQLYKRVVDDFQRDLLPGEACFSLGDCHPGAVLVPSRNQLTSNKSTVAVIDWEFSTIAGRGVNGDIAQLFASLRCHQLFLSYLLCRSEGNLTSQAAVLEAQIATNSFIKGFHDTYARNLGLDPLPSPENPAMTMLRSALILYGREIINQAFERPWIAGEPDPELVEDMVSVGSWYIEMAGEDTKEMLELKNWDVLMMKGDHILKLFGIDYNIEGP